MRIKILGRYWNLRFVSNLGSNNGTCDSPQAKNKEIRVQAGLKEKDELEICCHEFFHACNWHTFSEEFVDQTAKDLSHMLWRLGYRKEK